MSGYCADGTRDQRHQTEFSIRTEKDTLCIVTSSRYCSYTSSLSVRLFFNPFAGPGDSDIEKENRLDRENEIDRLDDRKSRKRSSERQDRKNREAF